MSEQSMSEKLISPNTADQLNAVKYKMEYTEVQSLLNHPGKPMFRLWVDGKEYFISLYRPSKQFRSYVFLYENNILVSVVDTEDALEIWKAYFGKYSESIPNQEKFLGAVSHLKRSRIYLNYSFAEKLPEQKSVPGVGTSIAEIGMVYFFIPGVPEVLIPAGVIIEALDDETYDNGDFVTKIKSNDYYTNMLEKYGSFNLGTTRSGIVERLGNPSYSHKDKNVSILIYIGQEIILYGLVEGKLSWVAYDYPLKLKK